MPWTSEQPLPTPRWGLAATICDAPAPASGSRIYAVGGFDPLHASASAVAYDTLAHSWSLIAAMPTARAFLAVTAGPGRLHALGGMDSVGVFAAHEIYQTAHDAWSAAQSMPTKRAGLAAVTGRDGLVYALGGSPGIGEHLATVEAYDPSADKWTTKASLPAARDQLAAAIDPDGLIYAIGGRNATADSQPTVYSYDHAHPTAWSAQAQLPTARTGLAAATGPDGRIYAIGGQAPQSKVLATVEAYRAPLSPSDVCLALVANLDERLADGGPRVRVQEEKGITAELASCHQQGFLDQTQYQKALSVLKAINKLPQTPPRQ